VSIPIRIERLPRDVADYDLLPTFLIPTVLLRLSYLLHVILFSFAFHFSTASPLLSRIATLQCGDYDKYLSGIMTEACRSCR
jgi:hypothetical protein